MNEIKITKDNFEQEVLNSNVPVLIDFWATWCGPCQMLAPVIEEIANESDGSYKVGKVNVDEEPELSAAFQVASIPTLVVIKDKKVANTAVGFMSKGKISELLK
jgi:thioredoxin 1